MQTANEAWMDAIIRHQVGLMRLAPGISQQVNSLLNDSERDLQEQIKKRYQKGLSTARADGLLKSMKAVRTDAWKDVNQVWADEMTELAQAEPTFLDETLRAVSPAQLAVTLPTAGRMAAIAKSTPFEGLVMRDWASRVAAGDLDRLLRGVQVGLTQGDNVDQIAKRLFGSVQMKGTDGLTQITRNNADSITRTAVNAITNAAKQEFYQANSDILDLEVFLATLDARTTLVCAGNDNKQFKLGQGPVPPLHWRCRSLRLAIINGEVIGTRPARNFTEKQMLQEYADKHGLGTITKRDQLPRGHKTEYDTYARGRMRELTGTVPAKLSYDEWLRGQTQAFQDDILGPARAQLFRDGLKLDKFTNREGDVLTLDQLRKLDRGGLPPAPPAPPAPQDLLPDVKTAPDPFVQLKDSHDSWFRQDAAIDPIRARYEALNTEERDALESYVGKDGYERLRAVQLYDAGRASPELKAKLEQDVAALQATRAENVQLMNALKKMEVENPTDNGPIYRGIRVSDDELASLLRDDEFDFQGVDANSASYRLKVAEQFAGKAGTASKRPVVFRLKNVNRGAPVHANPIASAGEAEVIIPDDQYKILGRFRDPETGRVYIDAEVKVDARAQKKEAERIRKEMEAEVEAELKEAERQKKEAERIRKEMEAEVEAEMRELERQKKEAERIRKEAERMRKEMEAEVEAELKEAERQKKEAERLRKEAEAKLERERKEALEREAALKRRLEFLERAAEEAQRRQRNAELEAAMRRKQQQLENTPQGPSEFIRSQVEIHQSSMPREDIDEVLGVMDEVGWSSLHQKVGGNAKILFRDSLKEFGYKGTNGLAWQDTGNIALKSSRRAFSEHATWTVESGLSSPKQKVMLAAVHEFGHNAHLYAGGYKRIDGRPGPAPRTTPGAMSKIDQRIMKVFNAEKRAHITDYADTNHMEYWAESFAKYHYDPDWLLTNRPEVYEMVNNVLQQRGLPTRSLRLKERWANEGRKVLPPVEYPAQPTKLDLTPPEGVVKDDVAGLLRRYKAEKKHDVYQMLSIMTRARMTPQQKFDLLRFQRGGDL